MHRLWLPLLLTPALASATEIKRFEAPERARRGEMIELRLDVAGHFSNPFDPDQITVDIEVEGPGERGLWPAYFTRRVRSERRQGREVLRAEGEGWFAVRLRPMSAGVYTLRAVARDAAGAAWGPTRAVTVEPAPARGFLRVDPSDPRALAFDDGEPFVAVGANLAWTVEPSAGDDLGLYLDALSRAELNATRLWLTHYGEGFTLEWTAGHGPYQGLGRYSLEVAERLDQMLRRAEAAGVMVQLVLWQHAQLPTALWSSWDENPYNARNGGPAATAEAYFTSTEVARLARQRLRYLAARYGAFGSLLAWEIMNEQDEIHAPAALVDAWCEARARELLSLDPQRHLITTSHSRRPSERVPTAQRSPVYALAQAHAYGPPGRIAHDAAALRPLGKPMLLTEFGLDPQGDAEQADPAGAHLSEGSWRALAGGFQGGAWSWWWDRYLRPNDLWKTQTPVARVARQVDLRGLHEPLDASFEALDDRGAPLERVGRAGPPGALLWVRAGTPQAQATLRGPGPGPWRVRAFDPSTGAGLELGAFEAHGGRVTVPLPPFEGALVVELRHEAQG